MTSADSQKLKKMVLVMHFLKASQSLHFNGFGLQGEFDNKTNTNLA